MKTILALLFLATSILFSQNIDEESEWNFSGNSSLTQELYGLESSDSTIRARRIPSQTRFVLTSSLGYEDFSMPMTFVLTGNQTNFITPQIPNQDFMQYVQNPMNFLSISPTYDWAQLNLGSQIPKFSDLSMGNRQIFGAGFNLTPGETRISGFYGFSQRAANPANLNFNSGAYRQIMFGGKVQYGEKETGSIGINLVRQIDDTSSILDRPDTTGIYPEEGLVASINFSIPFAEDIYFYAEAAGSAFTRNMLSSQADIDGIDLTNPLIDAKVSTRADGAGKAGFKLDYENWGINLDALFVGDGFQNIGYQFFQSDRFEATVGGNYRTEDGSFNFTGNIGQRFNNLQDTKSTTTNQLIGNANLFWQATQELSFNGSYTNFGLRNNIANDTLKIEMVSNSISLSTNYAILAEWATQNISLMGSLDDFNDFNTITGQQTTNQTKTISVIYSASLKEEPITGNVFFNHLSNNLEIAQLTVNSIGMGGNFRLFDNKFLPGITLTYNETTVGDNTPDQQFGIRTNIRYVITDALIFRINYSLNDYSYGTNRNNAFYRENFFTSSLSYTF